MEDAVNYNRWVLDKFRPWFGQSTLEVGIGHAGFYEHLPPQRHYVGLDVDDGLITRARHLRPDLTYVKEDVADRSMVERLGPGRFDTILCVNVLEHVEDDVQALANMSMLLCEGGHLLLFVPAFPALFTDLDRVGGHLRRYRKRDLKRLAERVGEVLSLAYFNPIGGLGWWLNRFVRHPNLEADRVRRQVKLFDRYVLPASRALDRVTRSVFGQSVICVVRRR
jgi:SAM-dependent methyltransferase